MVRNWFFFFLFSLLFATTKKIQFRAASYYDDNKDKADEKVWIKQEVMHPYTYAALAGIVGGLSVLLAKCV
jgi:hypothetical protein